jgi:hypothetical protein
MLFFLLRGLPTRSLRGHAEVDFCDKEHKESSSDNQDSSNCFISCHREVKRCSHYPHRTDCSSRDQERVRSLVQKRIV